MYVVKCTLRSVRRQNRDLSNKYWGRVAGGGGGGGQCPVLQLHCPSASPPWSIAVSSGRIRVPPSLPRCVDQAQGRMLVPLFHNFPWSQWPQAQSGVWQPTQHIWPSSVQLGQLQHLPPDWPTASEAAKSGQLASQTRTLLLLHGITVPPSVLFPSALHIPTASKGAEILAEARDLLMMLLIAMWRGWCLRLFRQCKPWVPWLSSLAPERWHSCGQHRVVPRQRSIAIQTTLSSIRRANDAIGSAWSQALDSFLQAASSGIWSSVLDGFKGGFDTGDIPGFLVMGNFTMEFTLACY